MQSVRELTAVAVQQYIRGDGHRDPVPIRTKHVNAPRERENADLGETLKNVQRQLMLEDLLVHDPVLSGEDPEVVARAYQAILSIAPRMASNKEVVRAALRQTVHSVAWNIQKKISALN